MHFGWNIGKAFSKERVHTATFIKNVFAHTLLDLGISTIEHKMSHKESMYKIKIYYPNYILISVIKTLILKVPYTNFSSWIYYKGKKFLSPIPGNHPT